MRFHFATQFLLAVKLSDSLIQNVATSLFQPGKEYFSFNSYLFWFLSISFFLFFYLFIFI